MIIMKLKMRPKRILLASLMLIVCSCGDNDSSKTALNQQFQWQDNSFKKVDSLIERRSLAKNIQNFDIVAPAS